MRYVDCELSCVHTGSAELNDLAPLRDGVVPVGLLGCSLDGNSVLCAGAQEPVAPDRHGQGDRLGHELGGNVLGTEKGNRMTGKKRSKKRTTLTRNYSEGD